MTLNQKRNETLPHNAEEKKSNFKGYSLFNDIVNVNLRTWNRVATFFNIYRDHGATTAKGYTNNLDDISKKQMYNLLDEVRDKGYEQVRKSIIQSHKLH